MDVKDINLNEYEVGECLANGNIVLRKKKSQLLPFNTLVMPSIDGNIGS